MVPPWSQMNLVLTASPISMVLEWVELMLLVDLVLPETIWFSGAKSSAVFIDMEDLDFSLLDKLNFDAALFKLLPKDRLETDFFRVTAEEEKDFLMECRLGSSLLNGFLEASGLSPSHLKQDLKIVHQIGPLINLLTWYLISSCFLDLPCCYTEKNNSTEEVIRTNCCFSFVFSLCSIRMCDSLAAHARRSCPQAGRNLADFDCWPLPRPF